MTKTIERKQEMSLTTLVSLFGVPLTRNPLLFLWPWPHHFIFSPFFGVTVAFRFPIEITGNHL
jgi:hypothetical protein